MRAHAEQLSLGAVMLPVPPAVGKQIRQDPHTKSTSEANSGLQVGRRELVRAVGARPRQFVGDHGLIFGFGTYAAGDLMGHDGIRLASIDVCVRHRRDRRCALLVGLRA